MSNNSVLFLAVCIILAVTLFGPHFGIHANGYLQPFEVDFSDNGGGLWGFIQGVADVSGSFINSAGFLFGLVTFQMQGMPVAISGFFTGVGMLVGYLGVKLVRGTS